MKKTLVLLLLFGGVLSAYDDQPRCYKELSSDFFPLQVTQQAFSLYRVDQPQWDRIWRELRKRGSQAPLVLKEQADRRVPSPFQAPFQIDVAEALLRQTMFDIFSRVVIEYGYYDPNNIRDMFDFIWEHDPRVKRCFPEKKAEKK